MPATLYKALCTEVHVGRAVVCSCVLPPPAAAPLAVGHAVRQDEGRARPLPHCPNPAANGGRPLSAGPEPARTPSRSNRCSFPPSRLRRPAVRAGSGGHAWAHANMRPIHRRPPAPAQAGPPALQLPIARNAGLLGSEIHRPALGCAKRLWRAAARVLFHTVCVFTEVSEQDWGTPAPQERSGPRCLARTT